MSAAAVPSPPVNIVTSLEQVTVPAESRLQLIDVGRACAALAVFGFHITPILGAKAPTILGCGWLGVQVFFVLSGFVIAHSVGRSVITPRYIGNFILRRSLRLDPPYWLVIVCVLLLNAGSNLLVRDRTLPFPGWSAIAANAFYLQNILGHGDLVDVFWSLAIEVQLYLAFILLMACLQMASPDGRSLKGRAGSFAVLVLLPLMVLSFAASACGLVRPKVWFINYWNEFFLGAMACWAIQKKLSSVWFTFYVATLGLGMLLVARSLETATAVVTASALLLAGQQGLLGEVRGVSWLAGLGRMSYSFYLLHTLVLARLSRLATRFGLDPEATAFLLIPLGFALSLGAACLFYRFVERPAVGLARRFKSRVTV